MLLFIDQEKHVRVVRVQTENGATARTPLGRIPKKELQVPEELQALLNGEETAEVEAAVELYRRANSAQAEFYTLNFPAITREVMGRFETSASAAERQLVMGALMDALRRMRRLERESAA
jgi:hypothetical protein